MLTPHHPRRRLRGLAAATVMAATMLVPASATMAMDASAAELDPVEGDTVQAGATADELRALIEDLVLANDALQADNSSLRQNVDAISLERDRLLGSLERFDDLYGPIEADRQLLVELRKGLPETRPEAEAQIDRIRSLALSADPGRLGQLVDRIDDAAPAFLDWRFGEFETTAEFSDAYIGTGANAFDSSFEAFRSEVLMSVANRLDGLLTILDRVR
ncbi:MAG: hypothetical protein U9O18_10910 [Chloroflexota bacterium]|nr:hypothetical protein [Chloroflexota bacterium]